MNIPGDEFYTLLNAALQKRGKETRQRALYLALREAILCGRLLSGSQLPGSRTLAQQLSLSRNTINAALDQLTLEGYLQRNRQGTRVAQLAHRSVAGHCRTLPSGSPGGSACCLRPCPGTRRCWRLPREPRLSTIFRYRCGGDCTIA